DYAVAVSFFLGRSSRTRYSSWSFRFIPTLPHPRRRSSSVWRVRSGLSCLLDAACQPEPDEAVTGGRVALDAIRRPAAERTQEPGTSANPPACRRLGRACRVVLWTRLVSGGPVGAPVPHVAVHVVQPPRVRLELADRRREGVAVVEGRDPAALVAGRSGVPHHDLLSDLRLQGGVRQVRMALEALVRLAAGIARGGAGAA